MAFPVWDELICCVKKAAVALTERVAATEAALNGQAFGNATLVGGTIAVADTSITANSIIILGRKTIGGTAGNLSYTLSAGVGFTITSSSGTDTSVISYHVKY
jgi:hypothetical protein